MKKKIIIFGGSGMLGHQILKKFMSNKKFKIICLVRDKSFFGNNNYKNVRFVKFDIIKNNLGDYAKIVKKNDIIINCIGLIKPYINDSDKLQINKAILINYNFPFLLNQIFYRNKIFQIATDCVYSGKHGNYKETDSHDALDIYGKSKSLGEIKNKNFYNLRCSIIGLEIKNHLSLVSWFLKNKNSKFISGYTNHKWNGLTTEAYSEYLYTIITQNIKIPNLLHIVPQNSISKFELLTLLKKKFAFKKLKIKKVKSNLKINRTIATQFSAINNKIWKKTQYKKVPSIREMIFNL